MTNYRWTVSFFWLCIFNKVVNFTNCVCCFIEKYWKRCSYMLLMRSYDPPRSNKKLLWDPPSSHGTLQAPMRPCKTYSRSYGTPQDPMRPCRTYYKSPMRPSETSYNAHMRSFMLHETLSDLIISTSNF